MSLLDIPVQPEALDLVEVPFGEWLPDLPALNNPGALEALNVIPADGGYRPFPQFTAEGGAPFSEPVRGAAAVIRENDVVQVYAATTTELFTRFGAGPWLSIYSGTTDINTSWKFIRVGDQMVAIHPYFTPIKTPVGTSTAAVVVGGSPPTAAAGAQVGDFLMLGNLLVDPDDAGGAFPSRVRWGGLNNIDAPWVTDPATQADYQDLPAEGGPVVAITGREYGTIFQARMINRASYRGLPQVFDIVTVEDKRGCIARDCVVDIGPHQFFIAEDGFFAWNGTNSTPIGDNKINRYFFNRLQWSQRSRILGAVDFRNGCVVWAFPTSTSGVLDELIIYSYRDNRWSHAERELDFLFTSATSNVTLDELLDPLESYTETFDSPSFLQGGRQLLGGFDSFHAYGIFDGAPMAATLDTGEYSAPAGRRVFVNNARPLVNVTEPVVTMQTMWRDQGIGQTLVVDDPVVQEVDGTCPIMADGRYARFRMNIPVNADWTHATGVEINRRPAGIF